MSTATLIEGLYLNWFCQPKCDRRLYRAVGRIRPTRIVQIGVGDLSRARRLLALARRYRAGQLIDYAGIDLFEARRDDSPSVSLKSAHRQLRQPGTRVRLIPGDPASALSRWANVLTETDLVIVDSRHDADDLARVWFFLPRMLHEDSVVARYQAEHASSAQTLSFLKLTDVCALARSSAGKSRAA